MIHPELWETLNAFDMDGQSKGDQFTNMLARENCWTVAYAQRAVREYKKFAFLSVISPNPLLPSDAVNQVWRLHISCSQHYWEKFCAILGKKWHHNPVMLEDDNIEALKAAYERTLVLYRSEFGNEADPEYWPEPAERFDSKQKFVRVDQGANLILQKPNKSLWRSLMRFAGVSAFPLSIVGYAINQSSGKLSTTITVNGWIMVASLAVVIAIFACLIWRMENQSRKQVKDLRATSDLSVAG